MYCSTCGSKSSPDHRFCNKCGSPLANSDVHNSPTISVAPSAQNLLAVQFGDRFLITRVLGRGGMGVVYEATDRELGEKLAIKVLQTDPATHAEEIERFKREIAH